ncbi:MAG: hypothetical protein AAFV53_34225, partial [Myxococcota bacterium]
MQSLPPAIREWLETLGAAQGWSAQALARYGAQLSARLNHNPQDVGALGRYQLMAEIGRGGVG